MGRSRTLKWYICFLDDGFYLPKLPSCVIVWRPKKQIFLTEAGEWIERGEELFPGYVFIGTCKGWYFLKKKLGSFLLGNGKPATLSHAEIADLRRREFESVIVEHVFEPGQFIKVSDCARSSYAGMVGRFIKKSVGADSVFAKVKLNLYGEKQIEIDIPFDFLESAE